MGRCLSGKLRSKQGNGANGEVELITDQALYKSAHLFLYNRVAVMLTFISRIIV